MPRTIRAGAFSAWLLVAGAGAAGIDTPFDAATRGARCDLEPSGALTCRYRVGLDLEFTLHEVNQRSVTLRLVRSSEDGDYRADREMMSQCVFVRYGRRGLELGGSEFAYAFVSGRNGSVHRSLQDCRLSR